MKSHLLLCFFVIVITFTTKTFSTSPQSSSYSSSPTQIFEPAEETRQRHHIQGFKATLLGMHGRVNRVLI
ncbi:hypothetical protein P8452_72970 [Trifolium repens]|nr:hypothetical protein P8452_72970 [Trifolium repens]